MWWCAVRAPCCRASRSLFVACLVMQCVAGVACNAYGGRDESPSVFSTRVEARGMFDLAALPNNGGDTFYSVNEENGEGWVIVSHAQQIDFGRSISCNSDCWLASPELIPLPSSEPATSEWDLRQDDTVLEQQWNGIVSDAGAHFRVCCRDNIVPASPSDDSAHWRIRSVTIEDHVGMRAYQYCRVQWIMNGK